MSRGALPLALGASHHVSLPGLDMPGCQVGSGMCEVHSGELDLREQECVGQVGFWDFLLQVLHCMR